MSQTSPWALISCWTAAASVCTFLLWIPLAAIAGSFGSTIGAASVPLAMFAYVFYSPILAPPILVVTAPAYLGLFWFWGRVCRRHPSVDMRWKTIGAAALAVSVAPGLATAMICTRVPSGADFGDLLAWFPCCLGVFWGAIVVPRWLFDSLHPGAFSEPSGEVPEA